MVIRSIAARVPTFNQPARPDPRRNPNWTHHDPTGRPVRARPYANHPDPTTSGELLLLAIKAGA